MHTTTQHRPATGSLLIRPAAGDLLAQVVAALGPAASRAGKDAYDYLSSVHAASAPRIQEVLVCLDLPSIRLRSASDPIEAALAVAAAALLDAARGRRLTGTERIREALDLLDDRLAAGW